VFGPTFKEHNTSAGEILPNLQSLTTVSQVQHQIRLDANFVSERREHGHGSRQIFRCVKRIARVRLTAPLQNHTTQNDCQ
jgi:hypothetical protein